MLPQRYTYKHTFHKSASKYAMLSLLQNLHTSVHALREKPHLPIIVMVVISGGAWLVVELPTITGVWQIAFVYLLPSMISPVHYEAPPLWSHVVLYGNLEGPKKLNSQPSFIMSMLAAPNPVAALRICC